MNVQPGPLVFDTQVLGRRPGTEKTFTRTVEAPADLGHDVIGVPEGSSIDLELRLEAVMEGVLVTGEAQADLVGECARCLEEIRDEIVADFQELFVYEESDTATQAEDEDVSRLEGDLLDLEPLLRDSVVLALPFQPLCQDDCPGLCTECGARLADDPGHQHDEPIDPRWAKLQGLEQHPEND